MIETGTGYVTQQEIINYVIVAGVAYWSYQRAIMAVKDAKIV